VVLVSRGTQRSLRPQPGQFVSEWYLKKKNCILTNVWTKVVISLPSGANDVIVFVLRTTCCEYLATN
jgi:hypothetical protein